MSTMAATLKCEYPGLNQLAMLANLETIQKSIRQKVKGENSVVKGPKFGHMP